jgi:uncharacterized membrane protein
MPFDAVLVLRFLHLFFAFTFVGSLVVTEWNSRAARRSFDWGERALLFRIIFTSSTIAGLGGLLLLGVIGNVLSTMLGYRMGADAWIRWVNGLWLIAVLLMAVINVPGVASLARMSKQMAAAGADAEPPAKFAATFLRWRLANVAQSALYVAMLALMVLRWRG